VLRLANDLDIFQLPADSELVTPNPIVDRAQVHAATHCIPWHHRPLCNNAAGEITHIDCALSLVADLVEVELACLQLDCLGLLGSRLLVDGDLHRWDLQHADLLTAEILALKPLELVAIHEVQQRLIHIGQDGEELLHVLYVLMRGCTLGLPVVDIQREACFLDVSGSKGGAKVTVPREPRVVSDGRRGHEGEGSHGRPISDADLLPSPDDAWKHMQLSFVESVDVHEVVVASRRHVEK
jgi:hypothetical protein